jgi:hypothetical protein
MGVLETVTRIAQLGGEPTRAALVARMRARFEGRTGAYVPEDPWFEERSRAFWCDAVTTGGFGRTVESELSGTDRAWLEPLQHAHRGLFQAAPVEGRRRLLVDAWSGAEFAVTLLEDASHAELDAASGQLFDARVVASDLAQVALLPGAVFHPRVATAAIAPVLAAARERGLSTEDTLDALLRMERTLRSLSRVKVAYAYRPEALFHSTQEPTAPPREGGAPGVKRMRRAAKGPT